MKDFKVGDKVKFREGFDAAFLAYFGEAAFKFDNAVGTIKDTNISNSSYEIDLEVEVDGEIVLDCFPIFWLEKIETL